MVLVGVTLDDGTVLETDADVQEGTTPVYNGATPTRPDEGYITFTFAGWSPEIGAVTEDITYTATYTDGIAPHTHTYTENLVNWTWDGYASATATFYCSICFEAHDEVATVETEDMGTCIKHTASAINRKMIKPIVTALFFFSLCNTPFTYKVKIIIATNAANESATAMKLNKLG